MVTALLQAFVEAERSILRMELQIPVYFANQTDAVTEWLQSLSFHAELNAPQTAVEGMFMAYLPWPTAAK